MTLLQQFLLKFSLDGKTHGMKIPLLAHNTVKIDGGHLHSTNLLICGIKTWLTEMSLYWLAVHKTISTYPELFGIYSHYDPSNIFAPVQSV